MGRYNWSPFCRWGKLRHGEHKEFESSGDGDRKQPGKSISSCMTYPRSVSLDSSVCIVHQCCSWLCLQLLTLWLAMRWANGTDQGGMNSYEQWMGVTDTPALLSLSPEWSHLILRATCEEGVSLSSLWMGKLSPRESNDLKCSRLYVS